MNPYFSVVIPLYNKARYVERAVHSVQAQTGHDLEIVVVDDGSTDGGATIVEQLGDPRIRVVRQKNCGVSAARNQGLMEARGQYVVFLDADDYQWPGFLDAIRELIGRFPGAGIYATNYVREFDDGTSVPDAGRGTRCTRRPQIVRRFYRAWSYGSFFHTSSACVPRLLLLQSGIRFPEGESAGEDQDVWFRLAERYPVAYTRRPLASYRIGLPGSLMTLARPADLLPCYERLASRLAKGVMPAREVAGARRLLASHLINVARSRLSEGRPREAMELLKDRRSRRNPVYWFRTWALLRVRLAV